MNAILLRKTKSQLQSYSNANKYKHQHKISNSPKNHFKSFHSDAFKTKYDAMPFKISDRQIPLHYPYHIPLPQLEQGRQTLNPQRPLYDLSKREGFQTISPKRKGNVIQDFMANTYLSKKSKKFILTRFQHKDQSPKKWFQQRMLSRQTTMIQMQQFIPLGVKRRSKNKFTEQKQMRTQQCGNRQIDHHKLQQNIDQFFKSNKINVLKETLQNQRKAALLTPRKRSRRKSSVLIYV